MKGKRWRIHAIFECRDCGKRWENYRTAQKLAKRHAEKHHHNVHGEIGIAVYYDGRVEKSA